MPIGSLFHQEWTLAVMMPCSLNVCEWDANQRIRRDGGAEWTPEQRHALKRFHQNVTTRHLARLGFSQAGPKASHGFHVFRFEY